MEFPPFYWSVLLIAVPALFWLLSRRSRRPTQMQIRLRNLPRNTDRSLVLQILQAFATRNPRIVSSTDIDSAELIVQSLTPSIDEKQSIATIQVICSGQAWPRSGKIMFKEHQVEFDADFADLTPLYWADEWMVDIIAVTGLGGRPIGSWQADHDMWLRDWLGPDLGERGYRARIFTYGYPSKLIENRQDPRLHEFARRLLISIKHSREAQFKLGNARPLILIGHSFGGLVIKEALVIADKEPEYQDIFHSCACLVMFGVPNGGLDNESFLAMTKDQKNEELVRNLGRESHYLEKLDDDFLSLVQKRPLQVIAIYEKLDTPSFEQMKDGTWSRTGRPTRVVPRESACSPGLGQSVKRLPSNTDHIQLAKIGTRDDPIYLEVVEQFAAVTGVARRDRRSTKNINVPKHRSYHFVGRQQVLKEMDDHFASHDVVYDDVLRTFVLRGDSGVGTREIALRYIATHQRSYNKIVWISSASEYDIANSFKSIAASLGIPHDPEIIVQSVLSGLSKTRGKVLLIYDDLNHISLSQKIIKEHLPKWHSSMRIIITTSCNLDLDSEDGVHVSRTVKALCPEDGVQLLRLSLGAEIKGSAADLFALGQAVGWLPLALQESASILRTKSYSVSTFLRILKDDPLKVFQLGSPSYSDVESGTVSTLKQSMSRIHQSPSTPYSAECYLLCSFLGNKVDHDLFELAHKFSKRPGQSQLRQHIEWLFPKGDQWTLSAMHMDLSCLLMLNLFQDQNGSWEQPPMMAQLARHESGEDKELYIIRAACFIHACAEELRMTKGGHIRADIPDVYYIQQRLVQHAEVSVEFCRRVLGKNIATLIPLECTITIAVWYIHVCEYALAIEMLEAGLEAHATQPIEPSSTREPVIIEAHRALSWALRKNGDLISAQNKQEVAIRSLEALRGVALVSGTPRKEVVRARGELATILRDRGRFDEAIKLQSEIVEQSKQTFGEFTSDTLHEMSCLSTIYSVAGLKKKSVELDREILEKYNKTYPEFPTARQKSERLRKMRLLAVSLFELGRYEEAKSLEKSVLNGMRKLRGESHKETAEALCDLAASCYEANASRGWVRTLYQAMTTGSLANDDLITARRCIEQTLSIRRELHGEDHTETKKAYHLQKKIRKAYHSSLWGVREVSDEERDQVLEEGHARSDFKERQ